MRRIACVLLLLCGGCRCRSAYVEADVSALTPAPVRVHLVMRLEDVR